MNQGVRSRYLKWVFKTAPVVGKAEYESLLTWNCDRKTVNEFSFTSWGIDGY